MSDLFSGVVPFVTAAEAGGFTAAARRLGLTPAAVSKAIRRLEGDLGVRLFDRTTRRVELSDEGRRFFHRCRAAVEAVRDGRDALALALEDPRGEVTVSLSPALGPPVVARLGRLVDRHPALRVHLRVSDHIARLVDEGVDVALRTGALPDSSLTGRRLRRIRWATVASPAYLATASAPVDPDDLVRHRCIAFVAPGGSPVPWRFVVHGQQVSVRPESRLDLDSGPLTVAAAEAGLGICQAFDFMVADALRAGRLVPVLERYAAAGPPMTALCLPGRQQLPRVRAVLDFLAEVFDPGGPDTTRNSL